MAAFVHKQDFTPTPSLETETNVGVASEVPEETTAIGVAVRAGAPLPDAVSYSWDALEAVGFEGKPGQTHVLPSSSDGAITVLVGVGESGDLRASRRRRGVRQLGPETGQAGDPTR